VVESIALFNLCDKKLCNVTESNSTKQKLHPLPIFHFLGYFIPFVGYWDKIKNHFTLLVSPYYNIQLQS
jgi:hypothetical protein